MPQITIYPGQWLVAKIVPPESVPFDVTNAELSTVSVDENGFVVSEKFRNSNIEMSTVSVDQAGYVIVVIGEGGGEEPPGPV